MNQLKYNKHLEWNTEVKTNPNDEDAVITDPVTNCRNSTLLLKEHLSNCIEMESIGL